MSSNVVNGEDFSMTDDEKYLFDLNGFLVIKNVLSKEQVAMANKAIDRRISNMNERTDPALRNTMTNSSSTMAGDGSSGRLDLGGVLEWGEDSKIFKSILAHPKLVPKFHTLIGKGYRMDHMPFIIAQNKGGEGFDLHGGTVDCSSGQYNSFLAYHYHNGNMHNALLACSVVLTDHNAGDGGFCVVPGSHKANMKMPNEMIQGLKYQEFVVQPVTEAGDVVLFSEGTVHGSLAWTPEHKQRRVCLYRFSPATNVYGRSYFAETQKINGNDNEIKSTWPKAMYDDLNDAQRSVLEPPYANRLDRPNIVEPACEDVVVTTRSAKKKEWDQKVFGTKYF